MASLTTLYADTSAGAATTTSSTYAAMCTIDASLVEASTEYLVLAFVKSKISVDDGNSRSAAQVAAGGSEITGGSSPNHGASLRENQDTDASPGHYFLFKYTSPETPVDITLEHRNTDNADTVTSHGAIVMFKLSDIGVENTDWFYAQKATSDASSDAWKNRETHTFTPAAEDDYLFIGLTKWQATNTSFSIQSRLLLDDTTTEADCIIEPQSSAEHQTLMLATVQTLDATEHTLKQDVFSESGAAFNDTDWSASFVMRLGALDEASWADSQTEVDPSTDGWNDLITVAHTPAAASDQFVLGSFVKDDNGTQASGSRLTVADASITVGDNDPQEGVSWDATDEVPVTIFGILEDWDGAKTAALEYDPNEATSASRPEDNTIVVFGPLALNGEGAAADGDVSDIAIPTEPTHPMHPAHGWRR